MLQMVRNILLPIMAVLLAGCNQFEVKGIFVPTGDVVQKRFEQSAQMNKDLKMSSLSAESDYCFYVATDPHIYETSHNLEIFNDAFRNDPEALFGVVLGDCIDVKDNLPKYLTALSFSPDRHKFDHALFHVLGNHDLYFNGWDDFRELIGPSVYWFEVVSPDGKDLFISLDTATGTLGSKQTRWLRSFLSENRKAYRHCVILTHVNIFYTDNSQVTSGNLPIEETYALLDLLGSHNVSLVLQGHDHYREDLILKDVRYTVLGTIKDEAEAPEYLIVNASDTGLHLDWITVAER